MTISTFILISLICYIIYITNIIQEYCSKTNNEIINLTTNITNLNELQNKMNTRLLEIPITNNNILQLDNKKNNVDTITNNELTLPESLFKCTNNHHN